MTLLKTFPLDSDAGYGFEWLRLMLEVQTMQEGVVGNSLKVSVAAAGGNRVDIAGGYALVKGDTGAPALGLTQGFYLQVNDATVANALTFDPGDANPRLDQVVMYVNDSSDLGSGSNLPTFGIVKGTPVAGTTLDNAYTNGSAAAMPNNAIRLADRLVPAGSNTIVAGDLRDRRRWARGLYASAASSATTALGGGYTAITGCNVRVELSGALLQMAIHGAVFGTADAEAEFGLHLDGANQFATGQTYIKRTPSIFYPFGAQAQGLYSAGSHVLELRGYAATGTVTSAGPGGANCRLFAREVLQGDNNNN